MIATGIDELLSLYATWGRHHYDEQVSQLDHALQTAALAVAAGSTDELVAAALLHDVGHLTHLAELGDAPVEMSVDLHHEHVGARYLATLLPVAVTAPIAMHVAAKRYRCALDPSEVARLSEGSQRSLVRQGGPMSAAEMTAFESEPHAGDAVALRGWDDAGKVTEPLEIAPLGAYVEMLIALTN